MMAGRVILLLALVGSAWSAAQTDVTPHKLCTGIFSGYDMTKERDDAAVIKRAETQATPGISIAEMRIEAYKEEKTSEATELTTALKQAECVEVKVAQTLSERAYTAIIRVLTENMAPITTRWSFMSEANFTDVHVREIVAAVEHNPSVIALGFRNNIGVGPAGGIAMAEMLAANHVIEELDLYGTNIRDEGASAIIAAAGRSTLQLLEIGKCGATHLSAVQLGAALVTSPNPPLVYVGLSDNELGSEGAASVAAAVASSTVLKQLDMAGVGADDTTAKLFGVALAQPGVVLEQLLLKKNGITDVGGAAIANGLKTRRRKLGHSEIEESSLIELDLKNNFVGDQTAFALANVLTELPNNALAKLRLDVNPAITNLGADRIGEMLKTNIGLTELDLEHTGIDCWGWKRISDGLEEHHLNHKAPAEKLTVVMNGARAAETVGQNALDTSEETLKAAQKAFQFENHTYETNTMDKSRKTGCSIVPIGDREIGIDNTTMPTTARLSTLECKFPFRVGDNGTLRNGCVSHDHDPFEPMKGVKPSGYWCATETHTETKKLLQWGQCGNKDSVKTTYSSDQRVFKTPQCIFPFKEVAPACAERFTGSVVPCVNRCIRRSTHDPTTISGPPVQLGRKSPETDFWCATQVASNGSHNVVTAWGQCSAEDSKSIDLKEYSGCTDEREPGSDKKSPLAPAKSSAFWCATKVDKTTLVVEEWGHCSHPDSKHIDMEENLQTHNSCSSLRKPSTNNQVGPESLFLDTVLNAAAAIGVKQIGLEYLISEPFELDDEYIGTEFAIVNEIGTETRTVTAIAGSLVTFTPALERSYKRGSAVNFAGFWCATKVANKDNLANLATEWGHCVSEISPHIAPDLKGVEMTIMAADYSASQPLTVQFFDPGRDTITFEAAITNVAPGITATLRRPCDQSGAKIASNRALDAAETEFRKDTKAHDTLYDDLKAAVAAKDAFSKLAMVPVPSVFIKYPECDASDGDKFTTSTTSVTTTTTTGTTTTTTTVTTTTTSVTTTSVTTTTTTNTTFIPVVADTSLTSGEIGGISAGVVVFFLLLLIVWMVHHRTGHLPRKNDARFSWEDPNQTKQIKQYGSEGDLDFEDPSALRNRAHRASQAKYNLEDSAGDTGIYGNPKAARGTSGTYSDSADLVERARSNSAGSHVRPSMVSVSFPAGPGDAGDANNRQADYIRMSAQERSSSTRANEPAYAFKDGTIGSVNIPGPLLQSFAQPKMGADVPGQYGVGNVAEMGADVPGQYGVGSVDSQGYQRYRTLGSVDTTMGSGEAIMQQVMQRMNTLERENDKLRRSVKASLKLSIASARSTSGGTSVPARQSRSSVPQAPPGAVVFDNRLSSAAPAGDFVEDSTYSTVQKKAKPELKPKASASATARTGGGNSTADDAVSTADDADAVVLPGAMQPANSARRSVTTDSAASIISVERLNPSLGMAGGSIAAPLGNADVLNPTRASGSQSVKVGTRRSSSVQSVRRSGGGSMVVPARSSMSAGLGGSAGAGAGRSSVKQAWSGDAGNPATAAMVSTAL